MKAYCSRQRNQATTLFEVAVIIAIVVFLGILLLAIAQPKRKYRPPSCTNNLKQFALAIKIWAGDHNGKYPMATSVTNGGVMELMNTPDAWKAFQVMSNELSTPWVVICPQDSLRGTAATNFDSGLKNKISYFIGLDTTDENPMGILGGDGNFLLNGSPADHGFVNAATNASLTWNASRHVQLTKRGWFSKTSIACGNISLADGSVQGTDNFNLANYLQQTGFATNRFFVP